MWLSADGLVLGALCLLLGSISLCCWMGFVLIGWLVLLVALVWLVRTGLDGARVGAAFSQVWENTIIVHLIHSLLSPTLALCSTHGTFQSALLVYWSLLLNLCSCLDVTRFCLVGTPDPHHKLHEHMDGDDGGWPNLSRFGWETKPI